MEFRPGISAYSVETVSREGPTKGCRQKRLYVQLSLLQYKLSKLDKYLSVYPSHPPVLVGAGHHAVGEREGLGVHHQQLLPLLEPAQVRPDDQDGV
jgi:hypothetical protein